jgi:hypothetical protein
MYKLMNGLNVVATSDSEIIYDPVQKGWEVNGQMYADTNKKFTANTTTLPVVDFKLLFTAAERIAIKNIRVIDEVVDDFYGLLDDPRLHNVRLNLQTTIDGVTYVLNAVMVDLAYDQATVDTRITDILAWQ